MGVHERTHGWSSQVNVTEMGSGETTAAVREHVHENQFGSLFRSRSLGLQQQFIWWPDNSCKERRMDGEGLSEQRQQSKIIIQRWKTETKRGGKERGGR